MNLAEQQRHCNAPDIIFGGLYTLANFLASRSVGNEKLVHRCLALSSSDDDDDDDDDDDPVLVILLAMVAIQLEVAML
jgi:hypothetical protein